LATIVGGIAASHTPAIAFAFDTQTPEDPAWAPIFEGFAPVRAWLEEKAPEVQASLPDGVHIIAPVEQAGPLRCNPHFIPQYMWDAEK